MTQNKLKILLVDDNDSVTESLSKFFMIKDAKYQIETANNGAMALDKYSKFQPDVVILDISMPIMDGFETLSRILKLDNTAKVIMSTANDEKNMTESCMQKGALGFITKPYSPQDLESYIEKSLQGGINNKEIITVFAFLAKKIVTNIEKMIGIKTSIILDDLELYPHTTKPTRLRVAPQYIKQKEGIEIDFTSEQIGFTTEIGGQLDGTLVSIINKKDLDFLFDHTKDSYMKNNDVAFELFNILNTNIISELSTFMNARLNVLPIREYSEEKDRKIEDKNLTKIKYILSYDERNILLEFYIWLNISGLFRRSY